MHHQPLLVVLRAYELLELLPCLERLQHLGVHHVELAWTHHPNWVFQASELRKRFPQLRLGAASVVDLAGLEAAVCAGLGYAVSPVLDRGLVEAARRLQLQFVPGVMSPTEVHMARQWGCSMVKLFPAAALGRTYWQRLAAPLAGTNGLPFCIAAGGLGPADVQPWLAAGVDAVALGGSLANRADWESLAQLVERLQCCSSAIKPTP